ncbi:MAG TPA: hypothetical protein VN956_20975 [Pyrinomonadaceae bacterium]|nr:hypothetical protein [Pyrinomonadaceae bacterium]
MTTKINWEKKGLIYCPDGGGYFKTHAARPIPYRLNDDTIRLFYSSRDADDRMLPTFIDLDIDDPTKIKKVCDAPLLGLGGPGAFDDSGVTLGSVVEVKDKTFFYYTGWKRRRVVSFELSIGIMVWDRGSDTFSRLFEGPILAQDKDHPLLVAGPFVMDDGGRLKMWYCSGTDWKFPDGNPEPIYTVYYAESHDGSNWTPHQRRVIEYKFDGEVVSAPWVLKSGNKYLMWYCTRGHKTKEAKQYTIGHAESDDGISWERLDDKAGISKSESGWDSEMVCYPAFYPHREKIYMFYSGNGVGRGGVGYAVAENFSG